MTKLTERLQQIADFVPAGSTVADIGTDHGFIPIYLFSEGLSPSIIAGDINRGPLEKMRENLERSLGGCPDEIKMRLGGGFEVFEKGEADTVIIAGMGGMLMEEILGADPEKTASVKTFILQPRNAMGHLREWLYNHGFEVYDEALVRESRFIWEILAVRHAKGPLPMPEQLEIGPVLIERKDALLPEFIRNKIRILNEILEGAGKSSGPAAKSIIEDTERKISILYDILEGLE